MHEGSVSKRKGTHFYVSWDTKNLDAAWMQAGSQMPACVPGAGWGMRWGPELPEEADGGPTFLSGKARFSKTRACV